MLKFGGEKGGEPESVLDAGVREDDEVDKGRGAMQLLEALHWGDPEGEEKVRPIERETADVINRCKGRR